MWFLGEVETKRTIKVTGNFAEVTFISLNPPDHTKIEPMDMKGKISIDLDPVTVDLFHVISGYDLEFERDILMEDAFEIMHKGPGSGERLVYIGKAMILKETASTNKGEDGVYTFTSLVVVDPLTSVAMQPLGYLLAHAHMVLAVFESQIALETPNKRGPGRPKKEPKGDLL